MFIPHKYGGLMAHSTDIQLQRTPLHKACVKAGGKMVDFHGWELPIQFAGIIAEHKSVREHAGIFDVSHMGQLLMTGRDVHKFLEYVTSNKIKNSPSQGTYTHVLNEKGGVVDDVVAFCKEEGKFLVVVNSATTHKDFKYFSKMTAGFDVVVEDLSSEFGMVAVQGPEAMSHAEKLVPGISELPRFNIKEVVLFGQRCLITRTGYTGEDGLEIMAPHKAIVDIWNFFIDLGAAPCGLGARDVLRLEAGYLLYGVDVDDEHTSYEASCGWVVKLDKPDFVAKAILAKQKEEGVKIKLTSFQLTGPGVPREHCKVFFKGEEIGSLTSGTYSPIFKGIGKGYVNRILEIDDEVEIESGARKMTAKVVKSFYKNRV
ncbi:Glycine cleavage system T protein [Elusimicrobium minutum Pei191]|uniref:aminomethyltransferase n=2 Tax=Elusimicrobium TaxID=423604 RepID=B2KEF8_ELUMP|nr:Glycine cleavage system T protein [Elusimicrobium minutum Pei191]